MNPTGMTAASLRNRALGGGDTGAGGSLYSGRACTRCGAWIANEALHRCAVTPDPDVRIAAALERIATAVESLTAPSLLIETPPKLLPRATQDCDPGDCTTRAA